MVVISTVALVIMPTFEITHDVTTIFVVVRLERTVALHDREELDDDLGARSDQDLALAGLLGVVDVVEGIVEDGSADHDGGIVGRFSSRGVEMRYLPEKSNVSLSGSERGECPQRIGRGGFCRPMLKGRSVSRVGASSLETTLEIALPSHDERHHPSLNPDSPSVALESLSHTSWNDPLAIGLEES